MVSTPSNFKVFKVAASDPNRRPTLKTLNLVGVPPISEFSKLKPGPGMTCHSENLKIKVPRHVLSLQLPSSPLGRRARPHGMGGAIPFDTLLLQAALPACWLRLGRGGRSGGTCRTARQSAPKQRRIRTIAAISNFGLGKGETSRTSAKECPGKTPIRLERQLP